MVFPHDAELAIRGAAELVNTAFEDPDGLADLDALRTFLTTWEWSRVDEADEDDLVALRALRPRLQRLWQLDEDDLAEEVNAMLRAANALPQLVAHDGWGYHLHATTTDAGLPDRVLAETAMAFLDAVRLGELDRLRRCEADDCDGVLVDLTRNRARRFCSTTCANRTHVAAYRARQGGTDDD